jgi:copper(I)-binding protein
MSLSFTPRAYATALFASILSALVLLPSAASAHTKKFKVGSIVVEQPWIRATPGGAKVAGGYLKITNTGSAPDRLTGGALPLAASVEVHEMGTTDGIMKMRRLENGLEIKGGQSVELKPGGHHVMFVGLTGTLEAGKDIKGTLVFEKAGTLEVAYRVAPIGSQSAPKHKHTH